MNVYIPTGNITDMRGPCSEGFHVPMKSEWEGVGVIMGLLNLDTSSGWKQNLKMPYTGYRSHSDGLVGTSTQGVLGQYRSCSFYDDPNYNFYASIVYLTGGNVSKNYATSRSNGITIRPFHDGYVSPDSSWTVIQGTLGSAGIFRDETNGLISITGDGTTGYTISDKNLGATTVYSDGDTLAETNCGKYYQWGNNYGFAWTGSVTTSSTLVNASAYGPGNYYSSSTFITTSASPYDWSSAQNDNLRGGVTGPFNINELKNAYIGEYVAPYLCFTANTANSTVKLNKTGSPTAVTLETSTDGTTWTTYTFGTTITLSNIGDKVYFRNTSTTDTGFSTSASDRYTFGMTGSIAGSGDVNYLLNKNSTTTISSYCYSYMFSGCASLTTAPQLTATTLADHCYYFMFNGCKSLTSSPSLPATTLAIECYSRMFTGCTGLTTIPTLPATTLADYCYYFMFNGCSKIKLSTTQTGEYQTPYRIPTTGTGTAGTGSFTNMFNNTGGTFTGAPSINTTYYTSNTVV